MTLRWSTLQYQFASKRTDLDAPNKVVAADHVIEALLEVDAILRRFGSRFVTLRQLRGS